MVVEAGDVTRAGPHLRRARPPLRPGRGGRAAGGHTDAVPRAGRRRPGVAAGRSGLRRVPAVGDPHARAGQAAAAGVRLVPGQRVARRGGQCGLRGGRAAGLRAADGRADRGARPLAGPRGVPRRPGLRRRHQPEDEGVHRLEARPRGAAVDRAEGLPGVRTPLPAGLERPGEPLAALDTAQRDDLRRPRHPRRLEHQLRLAPRHGGHRLVARAGGRRARVLLGPPAPRQPRPGRPERGRAVAADRDVRRGGRARRHRGPRRAGRPRRP